MKHIIIAFALLVSFGAQAAVQHELSGGTSSALTITDGDAAFSLSTGYGYSLDSSSTLQLTTSFSLATGDGFTAFTLLAGPRFNLPGDEDLLNRFFVGGRAGILSASGSGDSVTKFVFTFEAGKRFKLSDSVAFVPSVSFAKAADIDGTFAFSPLAFSIAF